MSTMNRKRAHQYFAGAIIAGIAGLVWIGYTYNRFSADYDRMIGAVHRAPDVARGHFSGDTSVDVQFTFADGKKRRFEGDIYRGVTVADAVFAAARAGNIDVRWAQGGFYYDDSESQWRTYKNNELVSGDARTMPLFPHDEIELR